MPKQVFTLQKEIIILFFLSILALGVIYLFNLDFLFADYIYKSTGSWQYQNSWFTNDLMHKYGKYSFILLYLIFFVGFFLRNKATETSHERFGKILLLISLLLGTASVSLLKHTLEVDCPWDLLRYGGTKELYSLFDYPSTLLPSSHCFPSGHASTAFTWLALYFYSSIYHPQYRLKILMAVLFFGFLFGFGQQLRGAHFISHDLWSLLVCLSVNVLVFKVAYRKKAT